MLCVVIGIVPPPSNSRRLGFLQLNGMEDPDGGETTIQWANDTLRKSWIVPDGDADDVPTMLLSAFLSNKSDNNNGSAMDVYGNDDGLKTTPEEFASFVQNELNKTKDDEEEEYQCEVWASAPAPLPLMTYGGERDDNGENSIHKLNLQRLQLEFRQKGMCVLPNVLLSKEKRESDEETLPTIRSMVDAAIHEAEGAIASNHPTIRVGEDSFLFREIASRSKQRFDLLIGKETDLYRLLCKKVLGNHSEIPVLLQKLFSGNEKGDTSSPGLDWEMDLSVVYSKPGANHQGWHADGGHTEGASDAGWEDGDDVSEHSRSPLAAPYAICLFVPLINLNHTVGFTQFWPGSHKHRDLIGFGPFAEVAKATWDGILSAGEAIVYDYRLLHRGMPNHSGDSLSNEQRMHSHPYRAVLQLLFRRSWYKERNNYGTESIYQASA